MYRPVYNKRTARMVTWLCGSLFAIFSMSYLYWMQPDLLATAQHLLSKGKTVYSPLWGAVVITVVLLLLQGACRRTILYPLRFHALYFFPSALVLGLLTSIVPKDGWDVRLSADWTGVAVWVAAYVLLTCGVLHYPDRKHEKQTVFSILWVNFLCFSILCCMVGSIGNTDEVYHYRLKAERYIVEGQDSEALKIGEKYFHTVSGNRDNLSITISSPDGYTSDAEVVSIAPFIDPTSKTFLMKVRLVSPDGFIPGMFVKASVVWSSEEYLTLPLSVRKLDGSVYALSSDGSRAEYISMEPDAEDSSYFAIDDSYEGRDFIIRGQDGLLPGEEVRVTGEER